MLRISLIRRFLYLMMRIIFQKFLTYAANDEKSCSLFPPVLHITNEDKFGPEICDPGEARVQKQAARRFQSLMAARSGDQPDH
jgi:hypothetical protein